MKTYAKANPFTVYKVLDAVSSSRGKLLSAGVCGDHELEYELSPKINYHPNMFVFDSLESARNYSSGGRVWECRTLAVKPAPERILEGSFLDTDNIFDDFWRAWELGENPEDFVYSISCRSRYSGPDWRDYTTNCPSGTLLCDDLMLVEEVHDNE